MLETRDESQLIFRHPSFQGPGLQLDFISYHLLKTTDVLHFQNPVSLFKQFKF